MTDHHRQNAPFRYTAGKPTMRINSESVATDRLFRALERVRLENRHTERFERHRAELVRK